MRTNGGDQRRKGTYLADFGIRRPQLDGPLNPPQHLFPQPHHANIVPSVLHAFQLLCYRRILEAGGIACPS